MKLPTVSRRTLLTGGAAVAAFGGASGAWVLSGTLKGYLEGVIREMLPDDTFAEGAIDGFLSDYVSTTPQHILSRAQKLAYMARLIGVAGVEVAVGSYKGYSEFKADLISRVLLETDYFRRSDQAVPVDYFGSVPVCANPFARFNP